MPTAEELAEWEQLPVSQRPYGNFVPRRYDSLRHVPAFASLMRERFERCLDLYMAPRATRQRLNIDPESLIPKFVLRVGVVIHDDGKQPASDDGAAAVVVVLLL